MNKARDIVRQGMEEGAVGFATGMSYHPNAWSDTDELVEICKVVAEHGGVYTTHLRDVNPDRGFGGGGVAEALEIGRRSGVKVHFSHYRTGPPNAGQVDRADGDDRQGEGRGCRLHPGSVPLSHRQLVPPQLPAQRHPRGRHWTQSWAAFETCEGENDSSGSWSRTPGERSTMRSSRT